MIRRPYVTFKVYDGSYVKTVCESYGEARKFIIAHYPGGHFASDKGSMVYYVSHYTINIVRDKQYAG